MDETLSAMFDYRFGAYIPKLNETHMFTFFFLGGGYSMVPRRYKLIYKPINYHKPYSWATFGNFTISGAPIL